MDIYFILWVITQYFFIVQIVSVLALGALLVGFCFRLMYLHQCRVSLSTSLPFGIRYSKLILQIFLPQFWNQTFHQEAHFLLLENCIINQDLDSRSSCSKVLLLDSLS